MSHRYLCVTYRDGREILRRECELGAHHLYVKTAQVGRTAFLELINGWNRTALLGTANGGPVHVYVAL
ncbi:hypothetical protein [Inquilinus sp. OTU3971]|uniref:hypothetical protein n=1 Tax=Inquilinus sp. OTU3971 TaxID=3043855 RepID=UPI00313A8DCE